MDLRHLRLLQGERNYIMQVVCEATQNGSVPVQVGAFECLVRIMSLYYDKMAFYMEQALFGVCDHPHIGLLLTLFNSFFQYLTPVDCFGYEVSRRNDCSTSGGILVNRL